MADIGKSDWADWDRNGDLLFARGGRLFRRKLETKRLLDPKCLLDTRKFRFRELAPTEEAKTWHLPIAMASYEAGA